MATATTHETMTAKIVEKLTNLSTSPEAWTKPWMAVSGMPYNGASKHKYTGINTFMLLLSGYGDPRWFTFNQAKGLGGSVRKGEKGWPVCYSTMLESKTQVDSAGNPKKFPLLKHYTVFNATQIEWAKPLPELVKSTGTELAHAQALKALDAFSKVATVKFGQGQASYAPMTDEIRMPSASTFTDEASFWAIFFHETTHWTGSATRLNRNLLNTFGSEAYAQEELVAELGSVFLCAEFGIDSYLQHPQYIASWLKKLAGDPKYIFEASKLASKAAQYLLPVFGATVKPANSNEETAETVTDHHAN